MACLRVNSVFWCLSLDSGATFIGWLTLVIDTFTATIMLPNIAQADMRLFHTLAIALFFSTSLVHIASCIFAIIGASKKNPLLLLPWLVGQVFEMIILAILAVYIAIINFSRWKGIIIAIIVYIPFQVYFWMCVYSLYCVIVGERRKAAYKRLQHIRQAQMKGDIAEATV